MHQQRERHDEEKTPYMEARSGGHMNPGHVLRLVKRAMDSSSAPIVIDNGSSAIKAGFAGEKAPTAVIPNVVGHPRDYMRNMEVQVGGAAQATRGVLRLSHPVDGGKVTNWDSMEKVWAHTFDMLGVDPAYCSVDHPVLLAEPVLAAKACREKSACIMFETFNVPAYYAGLQPVMALYASGWTTGLVCDIGDSLTQVVPVYEGYAIEGGIRKSSVGGRCLTEYFSRLLTEVGVRFTTSSELEVVREAKEALCYVAGDFEAENARGAAVECNYTLPDGQVVTVGDHRFRCTEALFDTSRVGVESGVEGGGLVNQITAAVGACAIDLRSELYSQLHLAGGTSTLPGLEARLTKELDLILPKAAKATVHAPTDRVHSAFIGASVLGALSSFESISKADYDEQGPSIVHRRCF